MYRNGDCKRTDEDDEDDVDKHVGAYDGDDVHWRRSPHYSSPRNLHHVVLEEEGVANQPRGRQRFSPLLQRRHYYTYWTVWPKGMRQLLLQPRPQPLSLESYLKSEDCTEDDYS